MASEVNNISDASSPVVIDNGSGTIKAGFAGEDLPRYVFPNVICRPKPHTGKLNDSYVGEAALAMRDELSLRYPIQHGYVDDWDGMERVWNHTFYNKLQIAPEEHPILLTEAPLTPKVCKEKMTQVMFETFNVPAFYLATPAALSLYASGVTTGIVMDAGDDVTHIVPIHEGFALPRAIKRVDLAGRDLTMYLKRLLYERGHDFNSSPGLEIVKDIKEKLCYVSQDFYTDTSQGSDLSNMKHNYELPDGTTITIDKERILCSEAMFQPALVGSNSLGLDQWLDSSVRDSESEIRPNLLRNIYLAGGTTLFPGLAERMQKELASLAPSSSEVKVIAPPNRKYSAWIGGSMMASLPTFVQMSVSKEEYDEYGLSIVHSKCV